MPKGKNMGLLSIFKAAEVEPESRNGNRIEDDVDAAQAERIGRLVLTILAIFTDELRRFEESRNKAGEESTRDKKNSN